MKFKKLRDFIKELISMDSEKFVDWLDNYLKGIECIPKCPPLSMERHLVVEKIYLDSNNSIFQKTIKKSISKLLESFEPVPNSEEYLFYLLSLVISLRPYQAKARLRRLLFSESIEGLHFEVFNLNTVLIIANCKYDIDPQLKEFITKELATRNTFQDYALACYKGLIYTYDESAYLFIPKLAKFWSDKTFYSNFSTLFKLSFNKIGLSNLQHVYPNVINELKSLNPKFFYKFNNLLINEILIDNNRLKDQQYIKFLFNVYNEQNLTIPKIIFKEILKNIKNLNTKEMIKILGEYRKARMAKKGFGFTIYFPTREISRDTNPQITIEDHGIIKANSTESLELLENARNYSQRTH